MTAGTAQPSARKRTKPGAAKDGSASDRQPSAARRALVENEIYEQATQLFAERGFAGTSLQDIANALGVTRPALYYYVKSKDEILERLVVETAETTASELAAIASDKSEDSIAKLRRMATLITAHQAEQPARFRLLILSEAELPEKLAEGYLRGRRRSLKAVAQVIDDGIRAGVFRAVDPRLAALGVIGMCNWTAWWFTPGGSDAPEDVAEQFGEMAVASVRRVDTGTPLEPGVAGALRMVRQDLDYLQHLLDE